MKSKKFEQICKKRGYHKLFTDTGAPLLDITIDNEKEIEIDVSCDDCGATVTATGYWKNPDE